MKKISGFVLMVIVGVLILVATLRAITLLLSLTGESQSAYGIGFIAGASVVIILFIALGLKAVQKGRLLFKAETLSIKQVQ